VSPKNPEVPIPNSYWVIPQQFLAGEYPIDRDIDASMSRLNRFLELGINCFIDLTQIREASPYLDILRSQADLKNISVVYHRRIIPDFSVPSAEAMQNILNLIDTSLDQKRLSMFTAWVALVAPERSSAVIS